jgi:hypothetical protein
MTITLLLLAPVAWVVAMSVGPGWAEWALPGGLPLGNLSAALALLGWPAAAALLARRGSAARRFALIAIGLALAWLPVSATLAGNLALNFSGQRGTAWAVFTLGVAAGGLVALAWSALQRSPTR